MYYENITNIYYVKVLKNLNGGAIFIKNKNDFYYEKNSIKYKFIKSLKKFINYEPKKNDRKEIRKLVVVYPMASAIIEEKKEKSILMKDYATSFLQTYQWILEHNLEGKPEVK